jgi:hypothetical protein
VNEARCVIDATELLADAIAKFAAGIVEGMFERAEQFAELAFYLAEHQVERKVGPE